MAKEETACLMWAYTFAQGTHDIPDQNLHNPGFEDWLYRCRRALGYSAAEDLIAKLRRETEGSRALSDEFLLVCGWERREVGMNDARMYAWFESKEAVVAVCYDDQIDDRPSPTESLSDTRLFLPEEWDGPPARERSDPLKLCICILRGTEPGSEMRD